MGAGEQVALPPGRGTLSGGPWTVARGALVGSPGTVLDGEITLGDGVIMAYLKIDIHEDEAGAIHAVGDGAGAIVAALYHVDINIVNDTGPAYCLLVENGGFLWPKYSDLVADGTEGYSIYCDSGGALHEFGAAIGTVAGMKPYWE